MRQSKTVTLTLDDNTELPVTCYELRVKDIVALGSISDNESSETELLESIQQLLPKATSLTLEQAQELAPSDLKRVYECFQAVNDVFFSIAKNIFSFSQPPLQLTGASPFSTP